MAATDAAIILVGGQGTRIRSVLGDLPKPLAPVAGKPFLEWQLRFLKKQGVRRVVFSSGYRAELIAEFAVSKPVSGLELHCVAEPQPLDTGGAFAFAVKNSPWKPDYWLAMNGDSLLLSDLTALRSWKASDGALMGVAVPDCTRFGSLEINSEGELKGFREKQSGKGVINCGIYLLRDELLREIPAEKKLSLERDLFPQWLQRRKKFHVFTTQAPFLDIGTPESFLLAEEFVNKHENFY